MEFTFESLTVTCDKFERILIIRQGVDGARRRDAAQRVRSGGISVVAVSASIAPEIRITRSSGRWQRQAANTAAGFLQETAPAQGA